MKNLLRPKTLLCANSNNAADNLAERLLELPILEGKYVRIMNEKLEDIHNIKEETLKPFSIFYKVLRLPEDLHEVLREHIIGLHYERIDVFDSFEALFGLKGTLEYNEVKATLK